MYESYVYVLHFFFFFFVFFYCFFFNDTATTEIYTLSLHDALPISIEQLKIDPKNIDWSNAFISLGIPDMRGIQNEILINWEDDEYHVEPGTRVTFIRSGISSNITINEQKKNYHFQFDLLLNGSQHLYFTLVGKITNIHLTDRKSVV